MDMRDHAERYFNKTIVFTAMVMKPPRFPKGAFVPGRMAMTCCAEDMTFLGYVCKYDKADTVKDRSWVRVEVSVKVEFWKDYKGEGPVLYASKVEPAEKPKQEVIGFN
jgi:uncharacterized membrane protein YcgQ (UPF0703/DUF1980 family)